MKKVIISLICVVFISIISVDASFAAGKPSINKFKNSFAKGKVAEPIYCEIRIKCHDSYVWFSAYGATFEEARDRVNQSIIASCAE